MAVMEVPKDPSTQVPKKVSLSRRGANLYFRVWVLGCLGICFLAGCSGDQVPLGRVTGTVTLDGQPVTSGVVHFMPKGGPAATGVIDAKGNYRLATYDKGDGAVIGSHTVYFAAAPDESYMASYTEADYAAGKPPPAAPTQEFLPAQYLTPSSSGLAVEVTSGSNTHDFSLRSVAAD